MRELGQRGAATALIALLTLSLMAPMAASVVRAQEEEDEEVGDQEGEGPEIAVTTPSLMAPIAASVVRVQEEEDEEGEEPEITAPGEDEGEEEEKEEIEREVEINIEDKEVEIESTLSREGAEGEIENKFEVEFSVDEGIEIKLKYAEEVETENFEREMELEFEVEFNSIVEFVDSNGDGLYNGGEGVSQYELEDTEFTSIDYTTSTADNFTMHTISAQTTDGVFKVTLHVAGRAINIGGELVKPNEVKIDIEINGYSYTYENSKLALRTKLKSTMETEEEKGEEDEEEKVEVVSGDYQGFFSWKKTALVDGVSKEVKSTAIIEDLEEGDKELYLIYEQGSSIVHDPKIGVLGAVGLVPAMPWILVIVAAILAALISIGATRYIVLRKGT